MSRYALSCLVTIVTFIAMFSSGDAWAALERKGEAATAPKATNPRPDAQDMLLPMPCGGSMAFKAVGVQTEGFLWDLETLFGCDNCDRQNRDYYERRYPSAVSGPFSIRDLPGQWHNALPMSRIGSYYFYLIGKYEVTNFQWKTVMEGWCPSQDSPLTDEDALPKTKISWFDAVEFARKYTQWLLDTHPKALPRFDGDAKNIGYVRLPTEAEWEYAARGGHVVSRSSLREQDFFPMDQDGDYSRYAVFRAQSGGRSAEGLENIGSREPNPLGLYDTAGNAAEVVQDVFHFSLGGRLHGSAGGFIRKGGSYISSLSEIMPGRREEVAFFLSDGPNTANDLGMRMAISGINTPGGNRPMRLSKEWETAGESSHLILDKGKNPLEELDRIIGHTVSPQERENLTRLRGILKDNNIALKRQNTIAAESLIRSSLFMVETVRNYGVRHKSFVTMIDNNKREREQAVSKKMSRDTLDFIDKSTGDLEDAKKGMAQSLDAAVRFYRSKVEESLAYPETLFDDQLALLKAELKGDDVLTRNMFKAHELYSSHVDLLRKGKKSELTREFLIRDILPENLREGLD